MKCLLINLSLNDITCPFLLLLNEIVLCLLWHIIIWNHVNILSVSFYILTVFLSQIFLVISTFSSFDCVSFFQPSTVFTYRFRNIVFGRATISIDISTYIALSKNSYMMLLQIAMMIIILSN